jgi:hypothetical protein
MICFFMLPVGSSLPKSGDIYEALSALAVLEVNPGSQQCADCRISTVYDEPVRPVVGMAKLADGSEVELLDEPISPVLTCDITPGTPVTRFSPALDGWSLANAFPPDFAFGNNVSCVRVADGSVVIWCVFEDGQDSVVNDNYEAIRSMVEDTAWPDRAE